MVDQPARGEYRTTIAKAFAEGLPELTAQKPAAIEEALAVIEASDIEIRVAPEEGRMAFREAMYAPAAAAYIDRAGEAGQALLDLYEAN